MWRISDDFWDDWAMLEVHSTLLENWTPYRGPGSWPDADMLPLEARRWASATSSSRPTSSAR
jgi:hypothetical protein